MKFKFYILHFLIVCGWAVLVTRLFQLQILPNERLESKINGQFATNVKIKSKRGDVFDRNGKLLATSVPAWSVFIDPQMVSQKDKLVDQLSQILKIKRKNLYKKLSKKNRFVWVRRKISDSDYKKIAKLNIKGLSFLEEYKRVYFNKDSMGFLIGRVDIDGNGLSGLELQYDEILKGEPLKIKTLQDGRGRPLVFSNENLMYETKGDDIKLNIDVEAQVFAAKELKKRIKEVSAKRAWSVTMSAETGEIIASVQVTAPGVKSSRNNFAVSEIHEPGSILKSFSFTKAASELGIKPSQKFSCGDDGYLIGRNRIKNSHKEDCDKMSYLSAFSKSLNTVSAEVAISLGEKKLVSHYKDLGFSEKTGVDFPGEAKPIFHSKLTGRHHLASVSFGHGVSLTPMQVVRSYSAFSKSGRLVKPQYLKGFTEDGKYKEQEFSRGRKVYSAKELFLAKGLLSSVVSPNGTGRAAVVPGYLIGGKTGTSQKSDLVNGGYRKDVLSSFIGVYPLSKPEYITLVMIDEPKSPRSGGMASGPVFAKIAEFVMNKNQILPDKINMNNLSKIASMHVQNIFSKNKEKKTAASGRVPDLKGFSLREAMQLTKNNGIKFKITGSGKIKAIFPKPGALIPKSKTLTLVLK